MDMNRDKIVEKINHLMAVASDKASSENEIISATLAIQRLMAKYDISSSDVADTDDTKREIIEKRFVTGKGNKWKYTLANIVARNFCCKMYFLGKDEVVFLGYEDHANVAVEVFEFLFKTGNKFANREYVRARNNGRSTYYVKNTYLNGFLTGIKRHLEEQCTALALVVSKEVEEAYAEITKGTRTIKSNFTITRNEDIYNAGVRDGSNAITSKRLAYV